MLTTYMIRHYKAPEIFELMDPTLVQEFLAEFNVPLGTGSWFYAVPYDDESFWLRSAAEIEFAHVLYEHGDCIGGEQIYIDFDD